MEINFKDKAKLGGIYQIRNLKNGKVYIGSAKCFMKRANKHKNRLNTEKHHNKHLLASWKKYGQDVFVFEILEIVNGDKSTRMKREQDYINKYFNQWETCYNLQKKVVRTQGPWSLTPEETRKKISDAIKKKAQEPSHRKKLSVAAKNRWRRDRDKLLKLKQKESYRKNLSLSKAKTYKFVDPDGKERLISNLKHFCKENNLQTSKFYNLINGKVRQYRKWTMPGSNLKEILEAMKRQKIKKDFKRAKTYFMIDPDGHKITILNMSKFCRENNLTKTNMLAVANGKKSSHKGWKRNNDRVQQ